MKGVPARFTLRRTGVAGFRMSVNYYVSESGNMTNRARGGTVTFPSGASSVIAEVGTYNDSFEEDASTITISLNPDLAHNQEWTVGTRNTSAGVVVLDDPVFHKPTLTLERISAADIIEGEVAQFRINRTVIINNRVLVRLHVADRGGSKNIEATLEPDATSVVVSYTTADRTAASLPGRINISLTGHADYNIINPKWAFASVTTNNPWVSLTPHPADSGATDTINVVEEQNLVITLTLHAGGNVQRSINWGTQETGTATSGVDYKYIPNWGVHWAVGETTKTITIEIYGDMIDDANETFRLRFTSPTSAPISFLGQNGLVFPTWTFLINITNEGALPKAYVSGMGREVSRHVMDSLTDRLQAINHEDTFEVSPRDDDELPIFNATKDGTGFWSSASSRDFDVAEAQGTVESYTVAADIHRGDWLFGLGVTVVPGRGRV